MSSSSSDTCLKFLHAALIGDMGLLKKTVAEIDYGVEGRYAKIRADGGCTALHLASVAGNTHICKYLIDKLKFDVNYQDYNGYTALHGAVWNNHLQTASYLLDNGASIAKTTKLGCTPFHFAAWKGGRDLLQLLLSRGSDIEAKFDAGTPLTIAACTENIEAVEFLLQNKANLNPVDSFNTPIIVSTRISFACTDLLIKAGADPNFNFCGETPLHSALLGSKVEIIMYLLKAGANPDMVNYTGLTPLEAAARFGNMKAMEILFPVTTKIPSIPDWSINGIIKYIKSKAAEKKINLRKKQTFHMAKSKGEEAFKREEYWLAINWYTRARGFDLTDAKLWSNTSLCYARLNRATTALNDAKKCVSLMPDWAKAHYREGEAWKLLKDYNRAAKSFSIALKINPNNLEIQKALREAIESDISSICMGM